MHNTLAKQVHTAILFLCGTCLSILAFVCAIQSRGGALNPGGEYFVPVLFYGLWRLDMWLLDRLAQRRRTNIIKHYIKEVRYGINQFNTGR